MLNVFKRILVVAALAFSTLAGSVTGIAHAAGCTSGTLIKGSLAAVYYCGADMKRYVFTNDKAYMTWYSDFSSVMTISDADLASIQIGGNATYRPGVKMIKIQTDPKVYAVAHGGVLRPIASEAVATCLYGSTWNKQIDDISDAFFTNYSVGAAINACSDFDKNAEMSGSQSVNQDKGLSTTSVSGSLSVSLASDNPSAATLPLGARGVSMLKFNVRNGGASSATVDSMTVHRAGPGSVGDIENVYLYEGATRLTTGRSVNSSTNDATFTGLNLALAAGQTRTLWVATDISTGANASDVHQMQLTHAMSGTTDAASLPLLGNNFTISGATVGTLTIASSGSISNPKLGEMGAKIAEFTISASSKEDVTLKRLTLYQGGNLAGANLTNLTLKQAGLTLATASGFDSNLHATFDMSAGLTLAKGQTKTFQVYADIGAGSRAGDSLELYVEEDADLYGVGSTFGFGVTVDRRDYNNNGNNDSPATGHSNDVSSTTVEAGQVTISMGGPNSANIVTGTRDLDALEFTVVSQANIEVRKMRLVITSDAPPPGEAGLYDSVNHIANFTDIKIVDKDSGLTAIGPKDVAATANVNTGDDLSQTLVYDDVFTLKPGQPRHFKVSLDVANQPDLDGGSLRVDLAPFQANDLRNLDNNTFLTIVDDVVPAGGIQGNDMALAASYITVTTVSNPTSLSHVKGTQGVDFLSIDGGIADGDHVTMNSLSFTGYVDADGSSDFQPGTDTDGAQTVKITDDITSCQLYDLVTGNQIGQTKSPNGTTGVLEFTGLDLHIDDIGWQVWLTCDLSNSAFRGGDNERIYFQVDSDASLNVSEDSDGSATYVSGVFPVNGAPTIVQTVTGSGSMTYALAPDDSESEAGLVLAGQSDAVLGKLRLTAANEELKQTKLRVQLVNSGNYSDTVNMSLYDGSTLVAGPVPVDSSGNADFSNMNFVVPKDGSKTLTVKAQLNTISGGAVSGDDLKISFDLLNAATGVTEYRGTSSSTVQSSDGSYDFAATDLPANSKILRKTKPTVSLASLPTSTLSNGTQVIQRFTVTADSAQQLSMKNLTFLVTLNNVSGSDLSVSGQSIREVGQGSDIAASTDQQGTCSTATSASDCELEVTFNGEQSIAAGTSKTYELRVNIAGADASGESISSKLEGDTVDVTGSLSSLANGGDSIAGTHYNFIWSDNSSIPHDDSVSGSPDWTDGRYVKALPSDTQTMSRS